MQILYDGRYKLELPPIVKGVSEVRVHITGIVGGASINLMQRVPGSIPNLLHTPIEEPTVLKLSSRCVGDVFIDVRNVSFTTAIQAYCSREHIGFSKSDVPAINVMGDA